MSTIARPAFSYYGSKWRMASTIIDLLPHHECYCESYGGSGAVILQKAPSYVEVFNDLDKGIVNFFRVLRDQPDALIRDITLTPMAREELLRAYEPSLNSREQARRFYVRAWQSRGNASRSSSGWRYNITNAGGKPKIKSWNEVAHLWAIVARLKMLQIECDDALAVIARFDAPTTVHYVDPPYPVEVRNQSHIVEYNHDMDERGHIDLAEVLHGVQGGVILSSYPCPLYEQLYADWKSVRVEVRTRSTRKATEVLWLSPHLDEMRHPLFKSLPAGV